MKKVLIGDDSTFMVDFISAMLEGDEFEILGTVSDGKQVLDKYIELKPDILLLDIVMPNKRGDTIIEEIIKIDPDANIVMISSLGTKDKVIECLEKGAKYFIQKPFAQKDLLDILRKIS